MRVELHQLVHQAAVVVLVLLVVMELELLV
jgi:hypothetical protein